MNLFNIVVVIGNFVIKIIVSKSPNYLFKVVNISNTNDIPLMNIKHNFYKNTFFPSTIIEWNKLDPEI